MDKLDKFTVDVPSRRHSRNLAVRVLRSPRTRIGMIMMGIVIAVAVVGPWFAPHDPTAIIRAPFAPPGGETPLGTDYLGHDVLSRFLFGGRNLIVMSICAALIGTALGAAVGLFAAYTGSWGDMITMRIMDVFLSFPTVIFALLFISMFGTSEVLLVSVVAIAHVPSAARVIRGSALGIVRSEYVLWARSVGLPTRKIVMGEILPNVVSPLMVEVGLRLMWSVGTFAALSFLGYGVQPPASDWGLMINQNRSGLSVQAMSVIPPILAIAVFTIGGNLFAEGVARVVGRTEERSA
ncbi:ABC transporter permease [Arthrobacter sp. NPDC080031]|uniref:ABC transporter permease n=1 Tax=Arthrobacter sp. NPDC080031 TaxID=3155918 RepID=UPI0034507DEC